LQGGGCKDRACINGVCRVIKGARNRRVYFYTFFLHVLFTIHFFKLPCHGKYGEVKLILKLNQGVSP